MSRKSQRNRTSAERQDPQASRPNRRGIVIGAVVAVLLAVVVGTLLFKGDRPQSSQGTSVGNPDPLASLHSPMLGDAAARVHIVEFIDPACETCAQFFPLVKQMMAGDPNRIRLSIRHVAFHDGSDYAVKLLEAVARRTSICRRWKRCWHRRRTGRPITPSSRTWSCRQLPAWD